MSDLDKAREWAAYILEYAPGKDIHLPAATLIQSLPDAWVDIEKVREIIAEMNTPQNRPPATTGLDRGVVIATEAWKRRLEQLITPRPQDVPEGEVWMIKPYENADPVPAFRVHQSKYGEGSRWAYYSVGSSMLRFKDDKDVTLISRMVEDNGETPTIAQKERVAPGQAVAKDVCNSEPNSSIKPEDVPPNEIWLVELYGEKGVGRRNRKPAPNCPWRFSIEGTSKTELAQDSEITLIHKLVPETHALPEGMRLADHAEYGRVVVSPYTNNHGSHRAYLLTDATIYGAGTHQIHADDLNFLDGAQ